MRDAFHDELHSIFDDLVGICSLVQDAVHLGTAALLGGDAATAEQVITGDLAVDRARDNVEERAFALLSLQAPVAGDLRSIVAALRMVGDLERMGDLAVHVAKIARLRVPQKAVPHEVVPTVARMGTVAVDMVSRVAQVISSRDVAAATDLAHHDEVMDQLLRETFLELLSESWSHGVEAAVDVALLARYYERIADHAVSVADRVVFVVTGQHPVGQPNRPEM